MSSIPLFGRDWKLVVDTVDVTGLDVQFHVSKSVKPEPNKAEITVFNLSPDHIAQFTKRAKSKDAQGLKGVRVELHAGYVGNVPLIFRGDMAEIATVHDGPDRQTKLAGHDGGRSYLEARVSKTFAAGTPLLTLLRACTDAMGVGEGNLADATAGSAMDQIGRSYPHARTLHGSAAVLLTTLLAPMGFSWSVQNEVIQVQARGAPLQATALRIAPDTGMVGSPAQEIDASVAQPSPDKPGAPKVSPPKPHTVVAVKTLMIPGLYPGRKVVLDTAEFKGGYQIVQADYVGDTNGEPWHVNLKLKVY